MKNPDDKARLKHMLDAALDAREFLAQQHLKNARIADLPDILMPYHLQTSHSTHIPPDSHHSRLDKLEL